MPEDIRGAELAGAIRDGICIALDQEVPETGRNLALHTARVRIEVLYNSLREQERVLESLHNRSGSIKEAPKPLYNSQALEEVEKILDECIDITSNVAAFNHRMTIRLAKLAIGVKRTALTY